jgi:hypothetical protein
VTRPAARAGLHSSNSESELTWHSRVLLQLLANDTAWLLRQDGPSESTVAFNPLQRRLSTNVLQRVVVTFGWIDAWWAS